jgi:hypothetical protein
MIRRPADQRHPTTPKRDTALELWVNVLTEVIVKEVLHEESETPNQGNEV